MPQTDRASIVESLVTVRDWLRYGVSVFTEAGLVFGHGTANATDEAAFLLLTSLHLPIDVLDPWLDCRLTATERGRILDLFEARIITRKPASYLTNTAWIQGRKFYVDERVIVPRSYIGELMANDGLAAAAANPDAIERVLELCTGSGCLAILAADTFPFARIDASDLSGDALEVARRNVADYGLEDRISLIQSDLFDTIPAAPYDLIIANPPYVTTEAVAHFPPEYRAEPTMAHAGGADGLDLVHRILADAPRYLSKTGTLIVEVGQAREALEASRPDLPFLWLDTEASEGEVFVLQAQELAP